MEGVPWLKWVKKELSNTSIHLVCSFLIRPHREHSVHGRSRRQACATVTRREFFFLFYGAYCGMSFFIHIRIQNKQNYKMNFPGENHQFSFASPLNVVGVWSGVPTTVGSGFGSHRAASAVTSCNLAQVAKGGHWALHTHENTVRPHNCSKIKLNLLQELLQNDFGQSHPWSILNKYNICTRSMVYDNLQVVTSWKTLMEGFRLILTFRGSFVCTKSVVHECPCILPLPPGVEGLAHCHDHWAALAAAASVQT